MSAQKRIDVLHPNLAIPVPVVRPRAVVAHQRKPGTQAEAGGQQQP